METEYDVFLSYVENDTEVAAALRKELERKGLRCFMARKEILPGREWMPAILTALKNSRRFLVVMTSSLREAASEKHPWIFIEIGIALAHEKPIITAIHDTNIPKDKLPAPLHWYQAYNIFTGEQIVDLAQKISTELRSPFVLQGRALQVLLQNIEVDFQAREEELRTAEPSNRKWSIAPMGRCNVGDRHYVYRHQLADEVSQWLAQSPEPYLFLVGKSGIGKTNFLITDVMWSIAQGNPRSSSASGIPSQAVVFLPLGSFVPKESFWTNIERLVNDRIEDEEDRMSQATFKELVYSGALVLILDGLDELVRVQGEDAYAWLIGALQENIGPHSRVIISCRDHIHNMLSSKPLFQDRKTNKLTIAELSVEEVRGALEKRLGATNPVSQILADPNSGLGRLSKTPLLLEMICEIDPNEWQSLTDCEADDLYDFWFSQIIENRKSAEPHLADVDELAIRDRIGKTAFSMLDNRSDFVDDTELQETGLLSDEIPPGKKSLLGILLKQTETTWSFVHDSLREFFLAKKLVDEFTTGAYDFLQGTSSFDYVGAETYSFVYRLLRKHDGYVWPIRKALASNTFRGRYEARQWNNIVRNCFEAIGMIADESLESTERELGGDSFIEMAMQFLRSRGDSQGAALTWKTKFNIVRCLERLHESGPQRPYFKHIREWDWEKQPTLLRFGAWAVRGFHRKKPRPGSRPQMAVNKAFNECDNPLQEKVSECLIALLDLAKEDFDDDDRRDAELLRLNAAFALIRWLHRNDAKRLKATLDNNELDEKTKGNLFLAVFRLGEDEAARLEILKEFPRCFDGMVLRHVPEEVIATASLAGYKDIQG